jgi:hypothetical protein
VDKEFIITYLKRRNYWWQTGSINPADKVIPIPRYLDEVRKIGHLEKIICLTGIRQSGKTAILFQYINYLLKNSGAHLPGITPDSALIKTPVTRNTLRPLRPLPELHNQVRLSDKRPAKGHHIGAAAGKHLLHHTH